jgi:Ca2+/H+ antiporter, TMEM165/GDT1 family
MEILINPYFGRPSSMIAILQSFLLVFASEMGDKTQLLALLLAARYRRPWTIMAGILVATLLNHALASWTGHWLASFMSSRALNWLLAASFFLFAAWILIPDKGEDPGNSGNTNVFVSTLVSFFLAEIGDKTQLATLALGARFSNPLLVTAGTTLGMLAADGLAVFFGEKLTSRIPLLWIRRLASALFAIFGLALLVH